MNRRTFLSNAGLVTAGVAATSTASKAVPPDAKTAKFTADSLRTAQVGSADVNVAAKDTLNVLVDDVDNQVMVILNADLIYNRNEVGHNLDHNMDLTGKLKKGENYLVVIGVDTGHDFHYKVRILHNGREISKCDRKGGTGRERGWGQGGEVLILHTLRVA